MHSEILDFLAEHRRTRTDPLTDRLVATIERDNPGYRSSGIVPHEDLRRSCFDNIQRVLELLADAVQHHGVSQTVGFEESYDAARETGRRRAEQGLPLDDVLRSFRIGGRLIWDDLVDQAGPDLTSEVLREIGTRLWEVVDETSAQVAAAYHRHERAAVRADEQQRAELWEAVLSGRAADPGFAYEAARILDLPDAADLLVVAGTGLEPSQAGAGVAPHASAWARRTGGVVGLVVLNDGDADKAVAKLRCLTEGPAGASDVSLGISLVATGLAGASSAYRQATLALQALDGRPGLASFEQVLPEALLLSSPEVAGRLVAIWLGPILALPGSESKVLIDTLAAWVGTGGSAAATAAAAHCHRNTVFNRLRRVSTLIGKDLLVVAPPIELDLALRVLKVGRGM